MRWWLLLVAVGCLAGGVAWGLSPIRVEGVSCGSVFSASRDAQAADLQSTLNGGSGPGDIVARCADRRSDRTPTAVILVGGGIVALLAAASSADRRKPPDAVDSL